MKVILYMIFFSIIIQISSQKYTLLILNGTNEVNFAILNFFGYQFAPRYKDIYDVVSESLYGFKNSGSYDGIIKPVRKINKNLIINEWENIKRIIVSLALKTTTQSTIIGKLSSHRRKNKTKKALWEYDNIIKREFDVKFLKNIKILILILYNFRI
jgi:TnpA family transposase